MATGRAALYDRGLNNAMMGTDSTQGKYPFGIESELQNTFCELSRGLWFS